MISRSWLPLDDGRGLAELGGGPTFHDGTWSAIYRVFTPSRVTFGEALRAGTEEVLELSAREVEEGNFFWGAWGTFLLTEISW